MNPKLTKWKSILALLLLLAMEFYMIVFRSPQSCAILASIDDGFYYPKIAFNFSRSGVLTYDNVTRTNGFHPLWEAFLIPVFGVVKNPNTALKVVYLLISVIIFACAYIFLKIFQQSGFCPEAILVSFGILFLNMRTFNLWFSMLESPLVLLFLAILILAYADGLANRRPLSFGFLAGLLFLARTDNVFLVATLFVAMLLFTSEKSISSRFKRAIEFGLGAFLIALPYLAWNVLNFGHLLPVSGLRKIRPRINIPTRIWLTIKGFLDYWNFRLSYFLGLGCGIILIIELVAFVVLALILIWLFSQRKASATSFVAKKFAPFWVAAGVHYVFIASFMSKEAVGSFWYLVPEIVTVSFFVGAIVSDFIGAVGRVLGKLIRFAILTLVVVLVFAQLAGYTHYLRKRNFVAEKIYLADFIRKNFPEDALFTMYDSGIVSFFSQRNFISANGLAGDYELARLAAAKDAFSRIIKRYGVDYVALVLPDSVVKLYSDKFIYQSKPVVYATILRARYVLLRAEDFTQEMLTKSK